MSGHKTLGTRPDVSGQLEAVTYICGIFMRVVKMLNNNENSKEFKIVDLSFF